jgi:hypothetical protein
MSKPACIVRVFAVAMFICAAAMPADIEKFKRIEIVFTGPSCLHVPEKVTVVIHYDKQPSDEQNVRPRDPDEPIPWDGKWIPNGAYASVRTESMRTDCAQGRPLDRDAALRFTFSACYPAQTLTITSDPPSTVSSWVRNLTIRKKPCGDEGPLTGMAILNAVQFNIEDVLLQLGATPPAHDGSGLALKKLLRRAMRQKKAFTEKLTRNGVVHELSVQRVDGAIAPSTNSSTAIDLDIGKLEFAKLDGIIIQVR